MADYKESEVLFNKIRNSHELGQFQSAFEAVTGMNLQIHSDNPAMAPANGEKANPFCRILNEHNRCPECARAAHCVVKEVSEKPKAFECFAGLTETAVPVLAGQIPVAYLTTGQVFTRDVDDAEWEGVREELVKMDYDPSELERLETAWKQTRKINEDQYEGMITLLSVFAGHLSELAERLILEQRHSEPDVVIKARQFVSAHLADKIELADVAKHVNLSLHHFCKVFKQATGLTFKQYLTRRRVEWAKCRLRKPDARVTEVAYDVGFGSLSQFNRSFQQLAGTSPTEWRVRERRKLAEAS
ncbi:MAG: AraC family transcriptional regulator [Verrucomicrobiales bacterium]|nr:AraC family transcriptional regulator [Verrucomicrobiales bacterium]